MRAIVFDTETTGLDPSQGDRLIEIAAVETIDGLRTDKYFYTLLNPQRTIGMGAFSVHGITDQMVADQPLFEDKIDEFLAFVGDDIMIAHNAAFDVKFLDSELTRIGRPLLARERFIDSLDIARAKFPGQPNSLDALCRRFNISLAGREKHSALLDARLLADVYLELTGGRQRRLNLDLGEKNQEIQIDTQKRMRNLAKVIVDETTLNAHKEFLNKILKASPVWGSL